jgi:two-component system, OmpR family, phosphate regulon sensor histidine kinase PhoR
MGEPHPNPLGRKEGLTGRVAPYIFVILLALMLILVSPADYDPTLLAIAATITVAIASSPWTVPWQRLPFSAQAAPPLLYFFVIAIIRESQGGSDSGFAPLVALPIIWLALYGTRKELSAAIVCAGATFIVPYLLFGGPRYSESEVGSAVLWMAVATIIGFTTQALVRTVRDQAEDSEAQAEVLRQGEEQTRLILETAQEAFVAMDAEGMIIGWNPEAEATFGWLRDEAIGRELAETLLPHRYRSPHRLGVKRFLESGEGPVLNKRLELSALHKEGYEFPVELTISPTRIGDAYVFNAFLRDITERKQADQYFRAQHEVTNVIAQSTAREDFMPKVLAALGESMGWELGEFWIVDRRSGVLRHRVHWHLPSIDAQELDRRSRDLEFERGVGLPGRAWEREQPVYVADIRDDPAFLRTSAAVSQGLRSAIGIPIHGDGGVMGVMVFFSTDIAAPNKELIAMMATLGSQVGQAIERHHAEIEADRLKNEFFSLVSHEFRTPLTSIVGYIELLEETPESISEAERAQFLGVVKRNSERLRRLVDDLLFISRVQGGSFSLAPRPLDLEELASHSLEAARPQAEECGLSLELNTDGASQFYGDPDRLAQLFDNLLSNAVKYTPAGEQVKVDISTGDEHVVIEVRNTGVYIQPEEIKHLFDRFFRASTASEGEMPGVGLGLTIAQSIVEAHGGEIRAISDTKSGTVFGVKLPLRQAIENGRPEAREVAA